MPSIKFYEDPISVDIGLYQSEGIVGLGQNAVVWVAALSPIRGADRGNNFVFIQCLPCPPPSLPDTLRHPEIILLPAHHNSIAVRNFVLSVCPSVPL